MHRPSDSFSRHPLGSLALPRALSGHRGFPKYVRYNAPSVVVVNISVDPFYSHYSYSKSDHVTLASADPHVLYFNPIIPYHLVEQADLLIGKLSLLSR
jgi:hypothetical protein